MEVAEEKVARQNEILILSAPALNLVRDIFAELRQKWRLRLHEETGFKDLETMRAEMQQAQKAPEILDGITHLFVDRFSELASFSEVAEAWAAAIEAAKNGFELEEELEDVEEDGEEGIDERSSRGDVEKMTSLMTTST